MVLIRRLIWDTETPSTAGAISRRMRRTPSSFQSKAKRGNMPMRRKNGSCRASCSAPPRNTAQPSASTGREKQGVANNAMPMKLRLSSTGVKAGMAKRLQVLRMPPARATSDMNRM